MNNPPYLAYRVKKQTYIQDDHPLCLKGLYYPIFEDDELTLEYRIEHLELGVYTKVAPGLAIAGIEIPDENIEQYYETRTWSI